MHENSLYLDERSNRYLRVVYIDRPNNIAYAISFDAKKSECEMPKRMSLEDLKQTVATLRLLSEDVFINKVSDDLLTASEKKNLEKRWAAISTIVQHEPMIFIPEVRYKLVAKALTVPGALSKARIYNALKLYWIGGKVKNALLPHFKNSGGKNKIRIPSATKRGRPRKKSKFNGVNIDEVNRKIIQVAYKKFYLLNAPNTLHAAYVSMLATYFCGADGKVEKQKAPSFSQFLYWGSKGYTKKEKLESKRGSITFNKDLRLLTSNSRATIFGPGSEFQIDSTVDNTYIVSSLNREQCIGRAYVYFVVDVFSGMVVGYSATLDPPSYSSAAFALLNAATNKKQFAEKFNVLLRDEDWPCHHLCRRILADRGELISHKADALVNNLGIHLTNTPSYRPELKGIVERLIRTIQKRLAGVLYGNGVLDRHHGTRLESDTRSQAVLSLHELNAILIKIIIDHNSSWIEGYPLTKEMLEENVRPIPKDLWNWGIGKGIDSLSVYDEKSLWYNFLQKESGRLDREGVKFKRHYYMTKDASVHDILEEIMLSGNIDLPIMYNPANLAQVYLLLNGSYHTLTMKGQEETLFSNLWEMETSDEQYRTDMATYNDEMIDQTIATNAFVASVISTAKAKRQSKKAIKKNVIENRQIERSIQTPPHNNSLSLPPTIIKAKKEVSKYTLPDFSSELENL